jgi:hypothetical protein
MIINEAELTSIVYTSESKKETTTRVIVPVTVPKDSIRAIDVSNLTDEEQQSMVKLVAEYKSYLDIAIASTYKFEDWAEHTKGVVIHPNWRTFKVSNIQLSE